MLLFNELNCLFSSVYLDSRGNVRETESIIVSAEDVYSLLTKNLTQCKVIVFDSMLEIIHENGHRINHSHIVFNRNEDALTFSTILLGMK